MAAVDEYQRRSKQAVFVEYVMLGPGERAAALLGSASWQRGASAQGCVCVMLGPGERARVHPWAGSPAPESRRRSHARAAPAVPGGPPTHALPSPPARLPADVNCTAEHAHQLGALLAGRDVLVNLIPWNPILSPSIE